MISFSTDMCSNSWSNKTHFEWKQ